MLQFNLAEHAGTEYGNFLLLLLLLLFFFRCHTVYVENLSSGHFKCAIYTRIYDVCIVYLVFTIRNLFLFFSVESYKNLSRLFLNYFLLRKEESISYLLCEINYIQNDNSSNNLTKTDDLFKNKKYKHNMKYVVLIVHFLLHF